MKKIVPFKKEIDLETNIAGINSISLEHTLEKGENNVISGQFIVSGTYKMTPSSVNLDDFSYDLPVNITIDEKYDIEKVIIDIHDFYYEIINDKVLLVNIEVLVDNLEEKVVEEVNEVLDVELPLESRGDNMEEKTENKDTRENTDSSVSKEETRDNIELVSNINEEALEVFKEETSVRPDNEYSIFDNMEDSDNYVVYKIHVVTENDTTESIMEEYSVTREVLEAYNDLTNIKLGDKVIIAGNDH